MSSAAAEMFARIRRPPKGLYSQVVSLGESLHLVTTSSIAAHLDDIVRGPRSVNLNECDAESSCLRLLATKTLFETSKMQSMS